MISRRLTGHRCQCTGCGEFFNSVSAFDWHRVTPLSANGTPRLRSIRRCLTVEEMYRKGMSTNHSGYWLKGPRTKKRFFPVASEIAATLNPPLDSQRGSTL